MIMLPYFLCKDTAAGEMLTHLNKRNAIWTVRKPVTGNGINSYTSTQNLALYRRESIFVSMCDLYSHIDFYSVDLQATKHRTLRKKQSNI